MNSEYLSFSDILKRNIKLKSPKYHRNFCWSDESCQQLIYDIADTADLSLVDEHKIYHLSHNACRSHFMGYFVCSSIPSFDKVTKLNVIDGIQRFTTLSLVILALRNIANEHNEQAQFPVNMRDLLFISHGSNGDYDLKLVLNEDDQYVLETIAKSSDVHALDPAYKSLRIFKAYEFILATLETIYSNDKNAISKICSVLISGNITFATITISEDDESPQNYFDKLNSTGLSLTPSELIRNFVLMNEPKSVHKELYENYWAPLEIIFKNAPTESDIDSFFTHFLKTANLSISKKEEIYPKFKQYFAEQKSQNTSTLDIAKNIYEASKNWNGIYSYDQDESNFNDANFRNISNLLKSYKSLTFSVCDSLVSKLLQHYRADELSFEGFEICLKAIISLRIRYIVCNIPTEGVDQAFKSLAKKIVDIDKSSQAQVVLDYLANNKQISFPEDEDVLNMAFTNSKVKNKYLSIILSEIESFDSKEKVHENEYWLIRIMPDFSKTKASELWQEALGPNYKDVSKRLYNSIGNIAFINQAHLYLISSQSEQYASDPIKLESLFITDKLPLLKRCSLKHINNDLVNLTTWNEELIQTRAQRLYHLIVQIWPHPNIMLDKLNNQSR